MRKTMTVLAAGVVMLLAFGACDAAAQAERDQVVPTSQPVEPPNDIVGATPVQDDVARPTAEPAAPETTTTAPAEPAPTETTTTPPQLDARQLDRITADLDALLGQLTDSFNQTEGDLQP